jgi:iron complex outermembrane receptor protein
MINATHFSSSFTDTTGATYYKDGGDATYKGIEAEATYTLFNGLSLYSSGSLSSAKYTAGPNAGLDIGGAPNFTVAGGLIYDDSHIFGSILTKVIGERYGMSGSDQVYGYTVNKVPTYESTDAVLGFRTDYNKQYGLGERMEFKVGVNNILDSRVVTDIAGTPATNSPSTAGLTYQFQPARTFYVAMKLDF